MLPSLKDVAVFLDASPTGQRVGQFAAAIAARHQAHLIGIHGAAREHTGAYVRGGAALQEVIDRRMESDERQGSRRAATWPHSRSSTGSVLSSAWCGSTMRNTRRRCAACTVT